MTSLFQEDRALVQLRPYQRDAMEAILAARERGLQRGLIVMPTGTGKTTVFGELVGRAQSWPQPHALTLAHREELLDQACRRIGQQNPGLSVEIEASDRRAPVGTNCVVAGVATIGRADSARLDWLRPGLTICDEAHHAPADTYMNVFRRMGCFGGDSFLLGVTATPHRLDNKPLHGAEKAIFEDVVYTYTLRDSIVDGWLCDLRGYRVATGLDLSKVKTQMGDFNVGQLAEAVNDSGRNRKALEHWQEVAEDRRTIVFCADVEHAHDVAELFREFGYRAEAVDGRMAMDERGAIIERFRRGETQVLTNVQIATEGFDLPEIACVLMLRPTQSWALYTQMVGRGLRILDGKEDCVVIDVVDNTARHNLATVPGMLGLPTTLDLQGHTVMEAVEKVESMDERAQAALFRRPTTFDNISTELQEIDLLAELSVPEALATVTKLSWVVVGENDYLLSCGTTDSEKWREVRMHVDTLGRWHARARSSDRSVELDCGSEPAEAFRTVDAWVRKTWPDALRIVSDSAEWTGLPATDKQIQLLRQLGVSETAISILDRGKASRLITFRLQARSEGKHGRKR
jgi:ATP-dependent helicase IRC3